MVLWGLVTIQAPSAELPLQLEQCLPFSQIMSLHPPGSLIENYRPPSCSLPS